MNSGNQIQSKNRVVVLAVKDAKTFQFDREKIVVGSVISADIRLIGHGVAPIHAVIEILDGKATVYDLASESGVWVNGKNTVTQELKAGDLIRIGDHEIRFDWRQAENASTGERVFTDAMGKRKLFVSPDEDLKSLLLEDEYPVKNIFDYRPSEKPSVEVVMSWCGTIIDVEHFGSGREVKIGPDRKCDFAIPEFLPTKTHVFVSRQGDAATLHVIGKMRGVVQTGGALKRVSSEGESGKIELGKNDFAKISIGDIDFYLSFTASPPRIKNDFMSERDPLFMRLMGLSLLTSAVVIFGLYQVKVSPMIEAEQLPERIATILYQPEKVLQQKRETPKIIKKAEIQQQEKTPPAPPPVTKVKIQPKPEPEKKNPAPKEMGSGSQVAAKQPPRSSGPKGQVGPKKQSQAQEGAGARAKGAEGKRGEPTAKAAPKGTPQAEAKRPSPMGGEGKGSGSSEVPDQGNLDLLKGAGAKFQDLLGNSAAQLGKSGSKLQGFGGFSTQGSGGQALSGKGQGGGGDAEGLGGLSDHGRGGGRVGTGMGAAGTGSGIIGGKTRVVLRSGGDDETVIMGAIDADAIRRAIEAHRDEFRYCYEKEINADAKAIAGKVTASFVIGSSGHVTQSGVETTTLKNPNVERCVIQVIKRIEFPAPKGGGIVQITYPFSFAPAR